MNFIVLRKLRKKMKRRPEPELMDSEAQTRAYAEAEFDEANSLFARKFSEYFADVGQSGSMADLGCGPGDISVRMAHNLPGWRYGCDRTLSHARP